MVRKESTYAEWTVRLVDGIGSVVSGAAITCDTLKISRCKSLFYNPPLIALPLSK